MFLGNNEISDYVEDIPMKLSAAFTPKTFNIVIPPIFQINETEYQYDFKLENRTSEMVAGHEAKLREEEEREEIINSANFNSLTELKSPEEVKENVLNGQLNGSFEPEPLQPMVNGSSPVTEVKTIATYPQLPVLNNSVYYNGLQIGVAGGPITNPAVVSMCHGGFPVGSLGNYFSMSPMMGPNFIERHSSTSSNLNQFQSEILRPQPLQVNNSDHNVNMSGNKTNERKLNRINVADFESSSSSPFDDALLKSIDEKQELNRVFQHL